MRNVRIADVADDSGVATAANQETTNATLSDISDTLSGTVTVNVGLTDAQLRASAVTISGSITADTGLDQPLTDTQLRATAVQVDGSGVTQPISAASLPLPSGAATEAKQDTTITSLGSIDAKLASTLDVDTGLDQPLTDTELRATPVPISGTVTANTGLSQPLTNAELRAAVVQTDSSSTIQPVSCIGTFTVDGSGHTQPVSGTFWQATQPVSGTVTANTGLSQPLTNTELRAAAVPVSGTFFQTTQPVSGTFFQATQPVSAVSLPLPTGAATAALQTQPGVDIGDVTVNNAGGGAAVNIQDGGNSITVDGSVIALPTQGTLTDRSGTATNASTTLMAANSSRKYLLIQNTGANGIWINFTTAAVAASPSFLLAGQNATFVMEGNFVSTEAVTVIRNGNSNQTFSAKEG